VYVFVFFEDKADWGSYTTCKLYFWRAFIYAYSYWKFS